MAGGLKKDFMKEMATELRCEEWRGFESMANILEQMCESKI